MNNQKYKINAIYARLKLQSIARTLCLSHFDFKTKANWWWDGVAGSRAGAGVGEDTAAGWVQVWRLQLW
jgi:hypothetical protein